MRCSGCDAVFVDEPAEALVMHDELASLVLELAPSAADLRLHIGVNSDHGIGL